jgi:hypothetical protein
MLDWRSFALYALTYRFVLLALPAAMGIQVSLVVIDVEASAPAAVLFGIFAALCVWFVGVWMYSSTRIVVSDGRSEWLHSATLRTRNAGARIGRVFDSRCGNMRLLLAADC